MNLRIPRLSQKAWKCGLLVGWCTQPTSSGYTVACLCVNIVEQWGPPNSDCYVRHALARPFLAVGEPFARSRVPRSRGGSRIGQTRLHHQEETSDCPVLESDLPKAHLYPCLEPGLLYLILRLRRFSWCFNLSLIGTLPRLAMSMAWHDLCMPGPCVGVSLAVHTLRACVNWNCA